MDVPNLFVVSRVRLALTVLATCCASFVAASPAHAINVSGTISSNQTWTKANSPYVITGNVTVAAGVTLTVQPGVVVKTIGTTRKLRVIGTLRAEGTAEERIVFTSAADDSAGGSIDAVPSIGNRGDWGRIEIDGGVGIFDYVDVRYAGYISIGVYGSNLNAMSGSAGISVDEGEASIDHARITDNMQTGVGVNENTGPVTIANSLIARNYRAIAGPSYSIEVDRTTIRDNGGHAMYYMLGTSYVGSNYIHDSIIARNGGYALFTYMALAGGSAPLPASMPHGTRNNIYDNRRSAPGESPTELWIPRSYPTVDWDGNFWGHDVEFVLGTSDCEDERLPGSLYHGTGPGYPLSKYGPSTCRQDFTPIDVDEFSAEYLLGVGAPPEIDPQAELMEYVGRSFGACYPSAHAVTPVRCQSDPVLSATGNFTDSMVDLALPGIGVPFEFERTYNSLDDRDGPLGRGWTHSYDLGLTFGQSGHVVFRGEHGLRLRFGLQADGSFKPYAGTRSTLEEIAGGYKLTRKDQVVYLFDESGKLTSIRDRNAQGLTFTHTGDQLTGITDSAGRAISLSYNAGGRLAEVALPDDRKVTYGYTNGLLTSVTDARGKTTTYAYDSGQRLASELDPKSNFAFRNTYGADGRVTEQLDALGKKTTFAWNATTETATATDARGKVWKDIYRDRRLVARVDPLANTTTYGYDDDFNLTSVTDPRGKTTTATYDADGNVMTRKAPAPLGHEQSFTYNARNDVTAEENGRGDTTTFVYDDAGNLTSVTEPGESGATFTTDFGRDPAGTGLLVSVTDPRDKTTTFDHDPDGNLTKTTTPGGSEETRTYDGSGRLMSRVLPRGNVDGADPNDFKTTYTYNNNDQLDTVTKPLQPAWNFNYDDAGNLESRTDPKQQTTGWAYDEANRLVKVTAPGGAQTVYGYNEVGSMTSRKDANEHTTTWTYDDANRLASEVSPPVGGGNDTYSYSYDKAGNLTKVVDGNGNFTTADATDGITNYSYDELNRLTAIDYSGSTPDVSFGYDENSNRTSMTDVAGTESYTYDPRNQLTAVTRGSDVFSYTYDASGNLSGRAYPGGRTTTYTYDDDGQMSSATSGGATTTYSYDPDGNLTETELPSSNGHVETRTYDNAGRLSALVTEKAGTTLYSSTYTYDDAGNPTAQATSDGPINYTYNARDQITEVCYAASCTGPTDPFVRYGYDGVGNRQSEERPSGTTTYDYDDADRLISKTTGGATTNYSFDHNGNQTQAGNRSFTYDLADRLKSTTEAGTTETYTYDGDGKRLTASTGAADTTKYLWDVTHPDAQLAIERDGSGAALRSYTYGNTRIALHTGGSDFYYHHDAIGSVTNLTSANGTKQWSYTYEPFGPERSAIKDDPTAPTNPIRFAGEQLDTTTGLYHLRARQYDPINGRFLATDPLAPSATAPYVNTYHYARNRPGVLIDPSGMGPVWANDCDLLCDFQQFLIGDSLSWDDVLLFAPGIGDGLRVGRGVYGAAKAGSGRLGVRLADETGAVGKYGNLGNLAGRADDKAADVIRSRGGGASQVNQLQTGYGELTLGELSAMAAAGDREAVKAIKMIKQAGSQGKGGR